MRNEKNILVHELIGLECEVVNARNKSSVGIKGKITDETMKTVAINDKMIFKKGTVFRIKVGDKKVDVDGDFLTSRPEDRIKKKMKKW
ncbi:ribonuclease P protein subunit [archaeon]|nr:ribonuclease P protein subunit [archaeon]